MSISVFLLSFVFLINEGFGVLPNNFVYSTYSNAVENLLNPKEEVAGKKTSKKKKTSKSKKSAKKSGSSKNKKGSKGTKSAPAVAATTTTVAPAPIVIPPSTPPTPTPTPAVASAGSIFGDLVNKLAGKEGNSNNNQPTQPPAPPSANQPEQPNGQQEIQNKTTVLKRVLIIDYNPYVKSKNTDLRNATGISDKDYIEKLAKKYIQAIKEVSGGYLNYEIVKTFSYAVPPAKTDKTYITGDQLLDCYKDQSKCYQPETVNYMMIVESNDLCDKRNKGEIDEVWLFGGSNFGLQASYLTGPNENSVCKRQLHIMGFNYSSPDEMLLNFGVRAQKAIMQIYEDKGFGNWQENPKSNWNKFSTSKKDVLDNVNVDCGTINFAPNAKSTTDVQKFNISTEVTSTCEDWKNFPNLTDKTSKISCKAWECTKGGYYKWWLDHLPKATGVGQENILNNWWKYAEDYEAATGTKAPTGATLPLSTIIKPGIIPEPDPNPVQRPPVPITPSTSDPVADETLTTKKVLVIDFNPYIDDKKQDLRSYMKWGNIDIFQNDYISAIKEASGGYLEYKIAKTISVDEIPVKGDEFTYTDQGILDCYTDRSKCHFPDGADYPKILAKYGVCEMRNKGEIDELWIWGGPYFGFWESNLTGPKAFFYNSGPTTGTTCEKQLPIMGFSYERGSEMLHNLGHRVESVMRYVYASKGMGDWVADEKTAWNKFTLMQKDINGKYPQGVAYCGNIHFPPNTQEQDDEYAYNLTTEITSGCEDWLNYPNLTGKTSKISCEAWGCYHVGYYKWWLNHLPKAKGGGSDGILFNWWKYIADYEWATEARK